VGRRRTCTRPRSPFTLPSADLVALSGTWSWLIDVVRPAVAAGPGAAIDVDLAYVAPWGFDPAQLIAPVRLVHGGLDGVAPSSHGQWLASRCPSAEPWLPPDDGHLSVLHYGEAALDWLVNHACV
jgi:pimeloyl-ACP methyl ester carboxylesterase